MKKDLVLQNELTSAVTLVEEIRALKVITALDFERGRQYIDATLESEKKLENQYKLLPQVIEAKKAQEIKVDISSMLKDSRKYLKNGPMLAYEQAQEAKRLAMERKLQAEAEAKAAVETARILAEKKVEFERAEQARRDAKESGDREAAQAAANLAKQIKAEAKQIKSDAATAIIPVVVLARTAPTVSRRMAPKFRIKDPALLPRQYLIPNEVAIGGVIRSLRENHGIPGVEYYEVSV